MKKKASHIKRNIFFLCIALISICSFFSVIYIDKLSVEIRQKFDGKRWAVPAVIYARPLELYPGLQLSPDMLEKELELAGYRKESPIQSAGGYTRKGSSFHLVTRDFVFPTGLEKSVSVRITITGNTVSRLQSMPGGEAVSTIRLDPARIGSFHPLIHEDRIVLKPTDIPPLLKESLTSVEDQDFNSHHGISPTGIIRAMLANIKAGRMVQGGSTLTQQLVKNFFLNRDRTLSRKLQEAVMAVILESYYTKEDILTAYVNEVFLGQDGGRAIHGFGLASQFYFRRDLNNLSVAQIATLVGMVKGPSYYDPRRNPEICLSRREVVLQLMLSEKRISEDLYAKAMAEPLTDVSTQKNGFNRFPAFLDLVRRQLQDEYKEEDLKSDGLKIQTTLDPQIQWQMEAQIKDGVTALKKRTGQKNLQVAMIITGREDGEVQAIAGDFNPAEAGFNRALDAQRPIGSLVKPAVYLSALEHGYTLASPLMDTSVHLNSGGKDWKPENYDKKEHGRIALYAALARSYNLATVNLGLEVGLENVIASLGRLGYGEKIQPFPSLLLGSTNMSPMQVNQIYQTIASGGFYVPIRSIRSVMAQDNQLLTRYGIEVEQRFSPELIFVLNHALERVMTEGTASKHHFASGRIYTGKTGTSNDLRDSWFAGFSDTHLATIWLGRDDNKPISLSGSSGALTVWGKVMESIGSASLERTEPANIQWVRINTQTLEATSLPGSNTTVLPFISGTAPAAAWSAPTINKETIKDKAHSFWDSLNNLIN